MESLVAQAIQLRKALIELRLAIANSSKISPAERDKAIQILDRAIKGLKGLVAQLEDDSEPTGDRAAELAESLVRATDAVSAARQDLDATLRVLDALTDALGEVAMAEAPGGGSQDHD